MKTINEKEKFIRQNKRRASHKNKIHSKKIKNFINGNVYKTNRTCRKKSKLQHRPLRKSGRRIKSKIKKTRLLEDVCEKYTTDSELKNFTDFTKLTSGHSTSSYTRSTTADIQLSPTTNNAFKLECEQKHNVRCVCALRNVLSDLNEIIAKNYEARSLLKNLAGYTCKIYNPINYPFKISADMKPRLISKKHKEMLVDEGNGPKEIESSTLDELLARGIPNEGIDFYVFPSTNIEVPCITTNKIQLSPNTADSTKYIWTHGNHKVITEGRFTEDANHRGSLQISGVTLEDSDNYTCTVNYTSPDAESPLTNSFLHTVLVVSEPLLALHGLMHYKAKTRCDQEILEMFELYLPQQIEETICENDKTIKICNVEIHNPMCHTKTLQESHKKTLARRITYEVPRLRSRWTHDSNDDPPEENMEMSLNYEVDPGDIWKLLPSTDNKTHCSPYCQQKVLLKVVEILQDSVVDAMVYPVESSMGVEFNPDVSTTAIKMIIACSGGLQLSQGFCVPCPKGHYSEEGSTECSACPPGTYQDNIGAKICEPCQNPFKAGCFEMFYSSTLIIVLVSICIVLLCICIICICCCCKRAFRRRQLTKKTNSVKTKKIKKPKKLKDAQKKEELPLHPIPPSLPSEDFSV